MVTRMSKRQAFDYLMGELDVAKISYFDLTPEDYFDLRSRYLPTSRDFKCWGYRSLRAGFTMQISSLDRGTPRFCKDHFG